MAAEPITLAKLSELGLINEDSYICIFKDAKMVAEGSWNIMSLVHAEEPLRYFSWYEDRDIIVHMLKEQESENTDNRTEHTVEQGEENSKEWQNFTANT